MCVFFTLSYSDSVRLNETKVVVSKGALYNIRPYEIERAGFKIGIFDVCPNISINDIRSRLSK
jgi:hypothetical protein